MAETTTIRLPPKLRARIHALAKQSGRSAHSVILEAVERHGQRPTEAVATIVYASRSLEHLERAFEFVRSETNPEAAVVAADAICSAVENLGAHPLLGRHIHGDIRELVISYGGTGYIALYRFLVAQGEIRVLAIRATSGRLASCREKQNGPRRAALLDVVTGACYRSKQ
jgi:plasmid stabilization system protein ParE